MCVVGNSDTVPGAKPTSLVVAELLLTARSRHLHLDKAIAQPLSVAWAAYHAHYHEHRRPYSCPTRAAVDTTLAPLPWPLAAPHKMCYHGHRSRHHGSIDRHSHQEPRIRHSSDAWRHFWLSLCHRYSRKHPRMACCACSTPDISRWRRGASRWNAYAQGAA
jgi:hypothetical protein